MTVFDRLVSLRPLLGSLLPADECCETLFNFVKLLKLESRALMPAISRRQPAGLGAGLQLRWFLLAEDEEAFTSAKWLVEVIVQNIPGFSPPWEIFIEDEDGAVREKLRQYLHSIHTATSLPGPEDYTRLRRDVLGFEITPELQEAVFSAPSAPAPKKKPLLKTSSLLVHQQETLNPLEGDFALLSKAYGDLVDGVRDKVQPGVLAQQAGDIANKLQRLQSSHANLCKQKSALIDERHALVTEKISNLKPTEMGYHSLLEMYQMYQTNLNIQRKAIEILEKLRIEVGRAAYYQDAARDLSFISDRIAGLYTVSLSFAVTGLLSVGKSTIVNCFTHQNLAPEATGPMTAIPTRYVHDPTAQEPLLFVPFFTQLNVLLNRLRDDNVRLTLEEIERSGGRLAALINRIRDKKGDRYTFQILREYRGEEVIREATRHIHDIFRLAVRDDFSETLYSSLPLDWSTRSLDSFLTVFLKFPGMELLDGLVVLSVVDTPGSNEDGVQKLNFIKVIRDTVNHCTFAAMVSNMKGLEATDFTELKDIFYDAKTTHRTGTMLVLTQGDTEEGWKATEAKNDTGKAAMVKRGCAVWDKKNQQLFAATDILPVSGLQMLTGSLMVQFIETNKRKPSYNSTGAEKKMVEEFLMLNTNMDPDYYEAYTVEKALHGAEALIAQSRMPEATYAMITRALRDGIPTLVDTTLASIKGWSTGFLKVLVSEHSRNTPDTAGAQFVKDAQVFQDKARDWIKTAKDLIDKEVSSLDLTFSSFLKKPANSTFFALLNELFNETYSGDPVVYKYLDIEYHEKAKRILLQEDSTRLQFATASEAKECIMGIHRVGASCFSPCCSLSPFLQSPSFLTGYEKGDGKVRDAEGTEEIRRYGEVQERIPGEGKGHPGECKHLPAVLCVSN